MRSSITEILQAALMALAIYFASYFVLQNTRIDGISMEPGLHNRQFVLLNKTAYWFGSVHRGDVIVFRPFEGFPEKKDLVKRIIGIPGDTVEIKGDGTVYVTPAGDKVSHALEEPYIERRHIQPFGPYKVPEGRYFVLGDNRPVSNDSRYFGAVPGDAIVGKVWLITWGGWKRAPNYPLALNSAVGSNVSLSMASDI